MEWNSKKIKKNAWDTAFNKGFKPWLTLVIVGFIFAFIGAANTLQTAALDSADVAINENYNLAIDNAKIIENYIQDVEFLDRIWNYNPELTKTVVNGVTRQSTWVVLALGSNKSYLQRNPKEALAFIIIAAVIAMLFEFFVQDVSVIGQDRFAMENRFQEKVRIRRIFAPFHRKNLINLMWVTFQYRFTMLLWSLTIVGGVIKAYQYCMVPFLLAENPRLSWKQAKRLSACMMKGYKWKMFCSQVGLWYMWLIKLIPIAGLAFSVPFEMEYLSEIYFTLRERDDIDRTAFIEHAFDGAPYIDNVELSVSDGPTAIMQPRYVLKDLVDEGSTAKLKKGQSPYLFTDYVFMFFLFSFIGYVWEVGLHLVQAHELVNRGTMYGPWLPIYGVGGTLIVMFLNRFRDNAAKLFGLAMVMCGVIEYGASFILDLIYNSSYWDYKNMAFNINGRICLAGLLAFGMGGLFGVYIGGPKVREFAHTMPRKRQIFIAVVLLTAFAADLICCAVFGFNSGAGVGETY